KLTDLPAELHARARVLDGQLERPLGNAQTDGSDHGALQIESAHDDRNARILDSNQILRRHAAVLENQLSRLTAPEAHLGELLGHPEAGEIPFHDESGN